MFRQSLDADSNVELKALPPAAAAHLALYGTLQTIGTAENSRRAMLYPTRGRFEAPNWTKDGHTLLFNPSTRTARS
jgi:hypothetical protein